MVGLGKRERPPHRDQLVFLTGCLAGALLGFMVSQFLDATWRSAAIALGFSVGMATVKWLQPNNAMTQARSLLDIGAAGLLVAGSCFLFEQPQLLGLSQMDVFIGSALLALAWMMLAHWLGRARRSRVERDTHGQD